MTWSLWVNSQVPELPSFLRGLWCILLGSCGGVPWGLLAHNSMACLIWSLTGNHCSVAGPKQTSQIMSWGPILGIFNPSHLLLHEDPSHINLFILLLPWAPPECPILSAGHMGLFPGKMRPAGARNRAPGLLAQSSHLFPSPLSPGMWSFLITYEYFLNDVKQQNQSSRLLFLSTVTLRD